MSQIGVIRQIQAFNAGRDAERFQIKCSQSSQPMGEFTHAIETMAKIAPR